MINNEILAYVAGLFDGEGSIVIGVSKPSIKKRMKSPSHWLQVGISNTNKEIIDWLKNNFGGHISNRSYSPSRKNCIPSWEWRVMSNKAKDFLINISPFVRIKKKQVKLAIQFQEERMYKGGISISTPEQINRRDWFKTEISKLSLRRLAFV